MRNWVGGIFPLVSRQENAVLHTILYNTAFSSLCQSFFEKFSEELSNQILFLSWKPAEKIFQNEFNLTINSIQLYLEKSKDIIATRRFFSKKWISNILRFFNFAKNFYQIEKNYHFLLKNGEKSDKINYQFLLFLIFQPFSLV